jgi:hypothetical protein
MDFFYDSQFWRTDSPKEYNEYKKVLKTLIVASGSSSRRKWTVPRLEYNDLSHDLASAGASSIPSVILPADSRQKGKSYAQLAAAWLKWSLEMPMTNAVGAIHPWKNSTRFDVTGGFPKGRTQLRDSLRQVAVLPVVRSGGFRP